MTTTLTRGATTITPDLIIGWDSSRRTNSLQHDVLDRPAQPNYTLRDSGPRSGVLHLFFTTYTAALAAEAAHATAGVWTLTETTEPGLGMRYVVSDGQLTTRAADDEGRRWTVDVPFTEVPA